MSFKPEPYLIVILRELCRRVGVSYFDVDFEKHNWYMDHSWTDQEANSFQRWMSKYLYRTPGARKELMTISARDKSCTDEAAKWFVWNHGWKSQA